MARGSLNKEIDDFVKAFNAGADIVYKYQYLDYLMNHKRQDKNAALRDFLADFRKNYQPGPIEGGAARTPTGGDVPSGSFGDQHKALMQVLVDRGVKPEVAAGAVGSMMGESGRGLNPLAFNANDKGSPSGGFAQWHADRYNGLLKFAGMSPDQAVQNGKFMVPFDKQKDFLALELDTEKKGVVDALKKANTVEEGTSIWTKQFEVPENAEAKAAERVKYGQGLWKWASSGQTPASAVPATTTPAKTQDAGTTTPAAEQAAIPLPPKRSEEGPEVGKSAMADEPQPQAVALDDDVDDDPEDIEPMQFGSRGGMIRRYEMGGAVDMAALEQADSEEEAVTPTPVAAQSQSFVDDLPEAIKGGLQGLQDKFGLNQQQAGAIPQANGGFMDGVTRLFSGEGAATPQEMATMRKAVDPNGRLGEEMGNIAALTAGYRFYLQQGDVGKARQLAAAAIMYSYDSSRQLGALAAEAIRRGDSGNAVKALEAAYNVVPNGKRVDIEGNKATVIDQKTGKPVNQFELTPELMFAAANKMADGSQYFQELMTVASGKMPQREVADPAFEKYVESIGGGNQPAATPAAAVPTTPAPAPDAATPKATPAAAVGEVDEEGLPVDQPKQFVPSVPKPALDAPPPRPDLAGMTDKNHRVSAASDYDKRWREWKAGNDAKIKDYNEAVKAEHEAWKMEQSKASDAMRSERSTIKQRRHDEAKNVSATYDEWSAELKAPPPPELAGRIKDIGQHLVESNDLHARDGISYANEIANPRSKIELKERKNGGSITMSDGETLNLTPRAFRTVKRLRDGYDEMAKKKAEEAKQPSALGVIGEGVSGWASHTAKRWGDVGRKLGVTREAVSLDSERR